MAAIVGRDRELVLAERFLEQARQRPSALVLSGEPGIGKTTVWEEVVRRAASGRGEIALSVEAADGCLHGPPPDTVLSPTQGFTITGGTGVFAGASGTGVVRRPRVYRMSTGHGGGVDLWEGTLLVPNLEVDLTPPTISGAVAKVVRAPRGVARVRVRYRIRANDAVEGAVQVQCRPRSGSLFTVGRRSLVRCSATDLSANTASASFTVSVRRR